MANYSKPDYFAIKAQKEGYPARSVYKLKEMDEKFGLLQFRKGGVSLFRVLDLGAAPGSWSLYILRKIAGRASGGVAAQASSAGRKRPEDLFKPGRIGRLGKPAIKHSFNFLKPPGILFFHELDFIT